MIAVTGASGYLGSRLVDALRSGGIDVVELTRHPERSGARRYEIGQPLEEGLLEGVTGLVHNAWDFAGPAARNVVGSQPLVDGARREGIPVVFVSSLAAHRLARSSYGRAKLELELVIRSTGGTAVRPGLIYGPSPSGLFGTLDRLVRRLPVLPLPDYGTDRLFLAHEDDVCATVRELLVHPSPGAAIFAAADRSVALGELVARIAAHRRRSTHLVGLPHSATALALALGGTRRRLGGVSLDSLASLAHPIGANEVAELEPAPVRFREFEEGYPV